jgi:transcriptional regulator with XRE-family HTH domain
MVDKDFATRLEQAVEKMGAVIPGYREGKHTVIAKKLDVSPEAVRKWFAGEAAPRWKTMVALAKYLDVDAGWLYSGSGEATTAKDKKTLNTKIDGVAHLALGMAKIEGASCAPPDLQDPRRDFIDFIMIKGGVQAAIHTSLGREISPGSYEFAVPSAFEQVRNVGFVFHSPTKIHIIDLKPDLIAAHKVPHGSDKAVVVTHKNGKYTTGRDEWPRINSIGDVI